MKRQIIILAFFLFGALSGIGQTINWDWQTIFQGSGFNYPIRMTQDSSGNSIVLGAFDGDLILDTSTVTCFGTHYYLAKFNNSGDPMWVKDLFDNELNIATDVDVNPAGEIFVSGWKDAAGFRILRLNPDGDLLSTISAVNNGYPDFNSIRAIEVTANNSIYIAGYYNGLLQLDTINNTTVNEDYCYFFIKMNSTGQVQFFKHGVTGDLINPFGVTNMQKDINNNFYIGGTTIRDMDFGNGVTLVPTTSCPFIVKFDSSGTAQWAVGSSSYIQAELQDFAVTDSKVYATGMFSEDFAIGGDTLYYPMESNIFFTAFSTDGTLDTVFSLSSVVPETMTTGYDHGTNIACDAQGNIYFTAMFGDTLYFGNDTLFCDTTFSSSIFMSDDYMVGKFDSLFQPVWAYTIGNIDNMLNWGDLYSTDNGNIFFVGVAFDSTKAGNCKSFIAKKGNGITTDNDLYNRPATALIKSYPNPVADRITIELADKNDKINKFAIFSISGTNMCSGTSQSYVTEINTSSLGNGNYIIRAYSEKGNVFSVKFLKQ